MAFVLDNDGAARIHEASLDLLENPGVRLEHDGIVAMLVGKGASAEAHTVRIPRELVAESLEMAPSEVSMTGVSGEATTLSASSDPLFWPCPTMNLCYRGDLRLFEAADVAAVTRLVDRLDNVHAAFGMAMADVPPPARGVVGLQVMAENCRKHIRVLSFSPEGAEVMTRMKAVVGDHPWFSVGFTAHGPLRWTGLALEIFKRTAGHGIPATVNGEPMAGASAPVTLAGAAAVGNAEILAGIVVNQALEPGRPVIYNLGLAHVFDMRTTIAVTGGPENALLAAVSAGMGRFYDMPSSSWVSTESMCHDEQAALEKMFGFHAHAAEGVSLIWGVGQLESELTFSPAQAVIDDEMISYSKRFRRGVEVTDDTLAVDVTREVGIAGSFLDHLHTAAHFREELFLPALLNRDRRATWEAGGSSRLSERAEDKASELMAEPSQSPLTDDQKAELRAIAKDFRDGLSG